MAQPDSRPTITQLTFQRKWLRARLDCQSLPGPEGATLLDELEDLDLRIAATPCDTVQELYFKLEQLSCLFYPLDGAILEDCLEHVMLASVLKDARALAGGHDDPGSRQRE